MTKEELKQFNKELDEYEEKIKQPASKLKGKLRRAENLNYQDAKLIKEYGDKIADLEKENAELKAQIEKIKWHFVKDELPPKSKEFKICSEDLLFITKNGKRYFGYFNSRNEFEAHNQPYGRFRVEEVYAWKEIVFPELKEE